MVCLLKVMEEDSHQETGLAAGTVTNDDKFATNFGHVDSGLAKLVGSRLMSWEDDVDEGEAMTTRFEVVVIGERVVLGWKKDGCEVGCWGQNQRDSLLVSSSQVARLSTSTNRSSKKRGWNQARQRPHQPLRLIVLYGEEYFCQAIALALDDDGDDDGDGGFFFRAGIREWSTVLIP
jgi:hypothetical protein